MKKAGLLHYLGLLLVAAVFAAAAWLLADQWRKHDLTPAKIRDNLLQIRWYYMLAAVGLTVLNYGVLACYDYLAFRFAEVPISFRRVAFAAVTSYSFSYNFGATIAGIPLRYRLYSSWGIPLAKIAQLLVILAFTFWFGVFALAGTLFICWPLHIPHKELPIICAEMATKWHLPEKAVHGFAYLFADSQKFGVFLLALALTYVALSLLHRRSLTIFGRVIPIPPPRLTLYQIGIASADMLVAGAVLFVLCPQIHHGYLTVLEVYLVAYVLNVLSHVPGGWGVIEAVIMTLLSALDLVRDPAVNMPRVFAAIVVFRVVYFLLPLFGSALLVGWHEYALRRNWISPIVQHAGVPESSDLKAPSASSNGQPPASAGKPAAKKP